MLAASAAWGCAPSADREDAGAVDTAAAPSSAAAARPDTDPEPPGAREPGPDRWACEDTVPGEGEEVTMGDTAGSGSSIHDVLERHRDGWMEREDVVGTGIGRCDDEPCLVIYLRRLTDAAEAELSGCVEGYPVRLEETGSFRPREGDADGG